LAPYVEHFRAFTDELLADEEDHRGEDDAKEN
jgi:hypothetical protein